MTHPLHTPAAKPTSISNPVVPVSAAQDGAGQ
jgi:hypothetical protein